MSAIVLLALRILMAALLYGFLGLAVYVLLRDLRQQGELVAARQPPPLTLIHLGDAKNTSHLFIKPEIVLGRELACDFPLDDQTVSSQHARLSYHHQQWWLEDLASTNGTYVNDERVTTPVVITHKDELRLGYARVKIQFRDDKPNLSDEVD